MHATEMDQFVAEHAFAPAASSSRQASGLISLGDHAWATALGRGRVQLTQEERALVDHGLISRLLDVLGDGPLGTELGLCNAALAILILGQRFEDAGPAGLNCPIGRASLRLSRLRRIVARRAFLAMDCTV